MKTIINSVIVIASNILPVVIAIVVCTNFSINNNIVNRGNLGISDSYISHEEIIEFVQLVEQHNEIHETLTSFENTKCDNLVSYTK